jgi:hypothetical protein
MPRTKSAASGFGEDPDPLRVVKRDALLRLLKAMDEREKQHEAPFYTRELLVQIEVWGYSDLLLQQAERQGLITRKREWQPKGKKGHWRLVNQLTQKGRQAAQLARLLLEDKVLL